jgi:hypothetical protein
MDKIKYVVNKEKGTVTAIATNCRRDVVRKTNKLAKGVGAWHAFDAYVIPDTLSATTRVHGADVFDKEKGKALARKKLLLKYHKESLKSLRSCMSLQARLMLSLDTLYNKECEKVASYKQEWETLKKG